MADSWSVPIVPGVFSDLNETIAKGPDLSWINNLANSYFQGKDQGYTQTQRDLFKNGIPNDPNQLASMLLRAGGTPQLQNYLGVKNLQLGQQALQQGDQGGVFSPVGQGPIAPPSSATAVPNVAPRVASAQPNMLPNGQPNVAADVPTGTPAPPGQNLTGPNSVVTGVQYGPVQTAGPQGFQSPPQMQPQPAQPMPGGRMDEATAQLYDQKAGEANRLAAATAMVNPAMSARYQSIAEQAAKNAQIIRGALAKNAEVTPEQKNAAASGVPNPLTYAGLGDVNKQDVESFQKRYTGLQQLGEASYNGLQKAQLMKQLTLDPNFYSGPLNELSKTYNQFKATFGANPASALPQEAFNKVTNDMLTEQVKAMGGSGVGRVLQSEVNIMRSAIASLGITPTSNRALAEIVSRVYQQQQDIANLARSVPRQPGQMNQALDNGVNSYLKSHPLFTPQELQDPKILGAPDAPPQSANWSPAQKQAWASRLGLKSGDPIRFNGQVGAVP